MKWPDVSIIVVNCNGREHLEPLFRSVERLDYPPEKLELICVDNGSRDGSVELLEKRFPAVRILRNRTNEGFAGPNNQAARVASGEILAMVNNDMRLDPAFLREGLRPLLKDEECAAVGGKILSWDGKKIDFVRGTLHFAGFPVHSDLGGKSAEPWSFDLLEELEGFPYPYSLFACGGAMLVRRDLFLELGGFDEDFFAVLEDVDFGWRLWLSGYSVRLAPGAVVFHRRHGTLGRSGKEKHRYLLLRNAMMMAVKNYSERNLEAILPALVILSLRRVVEGCHLQRENFYFWSDAAFSRGFSIDSEDLIDAMTEVVALDDVLSRAPGLAKKRNSVQQHRKRRDKEVLPRFGDPFRMVWRESGTLCLEERLELFASLSGVFGSPWPQGGQREAVLRRAEAELAGRIEHRQRELDLLNLKLDDAKRSLESYLDDLREARPLEPRLAVRRGTGLGGRLNRWFWLARFYFRFEGIGGMFHRGAEFALRRVRRWRRRMRGAR